LIFVNLHRDRAMPDEAAPRTADLFAKSPYDYTESDVEAVIAAMREARAAGHFRPVAHKAIAKGVRVPRQRAPKVAPAEPAPSLAAPKRRRSKPATLADLLKEG
jgi:hypothetical protein